MRKTAVPIKSEIRNRFMPQVRTADEPSRNVRSTGMKRFFPFHARLPMLAASQLPNAGTRKNWNVATRHAK
jgi:hypothetical protein